MLGSEKIDPNKKVKEGWIRSNMMIEALAVSKEAVKSALEKHVDKMEKTKGCHIYKKSFKDFVVVDKPFPNIDRAYSYIVELEMVTRNFETLLFIVMNFAPSSVEILEPSELKIDMGQAQNILVATSAMIHKFAQAGIGGIVVNS
jgi:hypothetical protein